MRYKSKYCFYYHRACYAGRLLGAWRSTEESPIRRSVVAISVAAPRGPGLHVDDRPRGQPVVTPQYFPVYPASDCSASLQAATLQFYGINKVASL